MNKSEIAKRKKHYVARIKNAMKLGKEMNKEWIEANDDLGDLVKGFNDGTYESLDEDCRHDLAFLAMLGLDCLTLSMLGDLEK